jgi:hypothetical protein
MAKFIRTDASSAREETQGLELFRRLGQCVGERWRQFRQGALTPLSAYEWEKDLRALFEDAAREFLQEAYNQLEAGDKKQAAPRVRYRKETYRINKKTKATIATSFGPITLWSWLYLNEEAGEAGLHPLYVRLGIVAGATPVLAERAGRWAVDHSQSVVRALLQSEHGLVWSNTLLRKVLREFRRGVASYRQEAQVERLLQWLGEAATSRGRHRPVLAVGRDGVMVPIRGQGYQEASAATVSVYNRRGKRLGTVYLGQMPEKHQATMTKELTALLTAVLTQWSGPTPRLAYITDKGQAQDDYWRRLRRMQNPRQRSQRLEWEWVLDFFHVCGYVSKMSDALFGRCVHQGQGWFKRMRKWLRERRQGVAQILRSAMQHYNHRKLSKVAQAEFWKAYHYLRKHSRWMDYAGYRRHGLPIGSGVTEAACKTVFTQRLKCSGMRWHKESAQVIVDLRVLHLSGIWTDVVRKDLLGRPMPQTMKRVSHHPRTAKILEKAP